MIEYRETEDGIVLRLENGDFPGEVYRGQGAWEPYWDRVRWMQSQPLKPEKVEEALAYQDELFKAHPAPPEPGGG